jgi:hypothetical protein
MPTSFASSQKWRRAVPYSDIARFIINGGNLIFTTNRIYEGKAIAVQAMKPWTSRLTFLPFGSKLLLHLQTNPLSISKV